jgi:hypothetical protein
MFTFNFGTNVEVNEVRAFSIFMIHIITEKACVNM